MYDQRSLAEFTDNDMIRSAGKLGAVKDKVKVKTTELSRFFGATIVSLRCGDVADVGTLMSP